MYHPANLPFELAGTGKSPYVPLYITVLEVVSILPPLASNVIVYSFAFQFAVSFSVSNSTMDLFRINSSKK